MEPKPLSNAVHKGFAYLISQQHSGGGWGQGGGWRTAAQGGRVEGPQVQDPPDVANTCVAAQALLRGGHSPRAGGAHAANLTRALDFIIGCVEQSDTDSPYVTDVRGTQVQTKIGPFADTFLASIVLAEAKGQLVSEEAEVRLTAALDKVVAKMERHQKEDGSWAAEGWAPVVGQALGSAGLNKARQRGARVSEEAVSRSEKHSRAKYNRRSKSHDLDGSAGVPLYGTASHLSSVQNSVNSYQALKAAYRDLSTSDQASAEEKARAQERLQAIEEAEADHDESLSASYARLKDPRFLQGFGSNGGEEFLSYLNISETLLVKGGEEWEQWDRRMTENLEQIQNQDGSWTGHHCITGRTFCTATALLVLMADRTPRPQPAGV